MLDIIVVLILIRAFYVGYKRGIVLQSYYLLAAGACGFVAREWYQPLAQFLHSFLPFFRPDHKEAFTYFFTHQQLPELHHVFYAGLAYWLIFSLSYGVIWGLGLFLRLAPLRSVPFPFSRVVSGIAASGIALFAIQMVLMVVATLPFSSVQEIMHQSFLAPTIIQSIPFTSHLLKTLWVKDIIG